MFKTQLEWAVEGKITDEMRSIARSEGLTPALVRERVAEGQIVVPSNRNRPCRVVGIGRGLSTKINASIGTSTDIADVDAEVRKAVAAREAGADTLMELSVGGDLDRVRWEGLTRNGKPMGAGRNETAIFLR
jgi:phosphomethylpyrimidine synthase